MRRRMFLTTLGALGLALIAPVARVFGYCRGARLIVNGVEMALPKSLDIRLEIEPGGAQMDGIRLEVVGGVLHVSSTEMTKESALYVESSKGGSVRLVGNRHGIFLMDSDGHDNPTVFCGSKPHPGELQIIGGK